MACTCKRDEACSDCPPKIGEVRAALLKRIFGATNNHEPADQIRNLATAYGILADKDPNVRRAYPYNNLQQQR